MLRLCRGTGVLLAPWRLGDKELMVLQPFNAFLAGFSATVGQFVLTASLRMQTNPENASEFKTVSNERFVGISPFRFESNSV